jgi:hypothetical protein
MQLEVEECSGCSIEKPIVNRKRGLCDDCNFKRLHNGESKQDIYSRRSIERSKGIEPKKISKKTEASPVAVLKKKFSIKAISSKQKYKCSDGTVVSEAQIKLNYALAIDKIKLEREPVCQGCDRGDRPLSFSHTISRARCKELGKAELIWYLPNIEIECFGERASNSEMCHNIWEDASWEVKSGLRNINNKISLIKLHDPEGYRKLPENLKQTENLWALHCV